jgi:hypothetical protein
MRLQKGDPTVNWVHIFLRIFYLKKELIPEASHSVQNDPPLDTVPYQFRLVHLFTSVYLEATPVLHSQPLLGVLSGFIPLGCPLKTLFTFSYFPRMSWKPRALKHF